MIITLSIVIMMLVSLTTGCFNFERKYPEKSHFLLNVSRPGKDASPQTERILKMTRFNVSPPYAGKNLVYSKGNLDYESDFYNEFFISPGSMITEEVHEWLAGSGLFRHVADSSSQVEPDYLLEGKITALYGDYRDKTKYKAILGVEFLLIHNGTDHPRIVFNQAYHKEMPMKDNLPHALVKGWSEALHKILIQFEGDLRAVSPWGETGRSLR